MEEKKDLNFMVIYANDITWMIFNGISLCFFCWKKNSIIQLEVIKIKSRKSSCDSLTFHILIVAVIAYAYVSYLSLKWQCTWILSSWELKKNHFNNEKLFWRTKYCYKKNKWKLCHSRVMFFPLIKFFTFI